MTWTVSVMTQGMTSSLCHFFIAGCISISCRKNPKTDHVHFSFSDDTENSRDCFKIIHYVFRRETWDFFMFLLKCMLIVLRLCCLKKGELILSKSSNHTIKLRTISILYCSLTDWFLLVNFRAEFHTAESRGSNYRW